MMTSNFTTLPINPVGFNQSNNLSAISINETQRPRALRLLVAANGPKDVAFAQAIAVRLSKDPQIITRAVVDDMTHRLTQEIIVLKNRSLKGSNSSDSLASKDIEVAQQQAFGLVEWADLLVLAPLDADNLAKMMHGVCDSLLLEILRGWDASKRVLLVPGMTTKMWESPITKRQMSKLHRKWNWIRVLPPILWRYEGNHTKPIVTWDSFNEVVAIIKNQADLLSLGHDVDVAIQQLSLTATNTAAGHTDGQKARTVLPPELWSMILEFTNDWELSKSLGIYTNLEMPTGQGWRLEPNDPNDPLQVFIHDLEWTLLTTDTTAICSKLAEAPSNFHDLSALATHLIFRFSLLGVLSYIEANCPHIFKCFDGRIIPTKASAYYGRMDILDWWVRSPSFLEKQYDAEALNGASAKGFIHILEWWRRSGLPLKYTEAAFEQASSMGHLHALAWWREASLQDPSIELKPGRSLLGAAQWGRLAVVRWWEESGIAAGHQEHVCKMASRWGHVDVLELWRELKGDDGIQFDSGVLIDPTYHSHIAVLDWWKKYAHGELPGMDGRRCKRVEYRTMDIEEALEDSLGDQTRVRRWWAESGFNPGLGMSEWMKTKYL